MVPFNCRASCSARIYELKFDMRIDALAQRILYGEHDTRALLFE